MPYRKYLLEAWESGNRKTFQYLGLFCFLVSVYAIYLAILFRMIHVGGAPDSLFGPLTLKLCFISALPVAVLAYSDKDWGSNDAAPVCVAAWIAVCFGFSLRCTLCALGMTTVFFPFILSALAAHGFGTLCRFAKDRVYQE